MAEPAKLVGLVENGSVEPLPAWKVGLVKGTLVSLPSLPVRGAGLVKGGSEEPLPVMGVGPMKDG